MSDREQSAVQPLPDIPRKVPRDVKTNVYGALSTMSESAPLGTDAGADAEADEDGSVVVTKERACRDKPKWHLLNWGLLEEVVEVMTAGATEYGEYDYRRIDDWNNIYSDALDRHLMQRRKGEHYDNGPRGSGRRHLAHVIANAMILAEREEMENE